MKNDKCEKNKSQMSMSKYEQRNMEVFRHYMKKESDGTDVMLHGSLFNRLAMKTGNEADKCTGNENPKNEARCFILSQTEGLDESGE